MTPVYFPFTYIGRQRLEQLLAFFPSLTVLQPTGRPAGPALAEAARQGRVNLRFPPRETGSRAESLMREYHQWAQARPKADLAAFAGLQQAALFSDDGDTHRITDSIRRAAGGHGQTAPEDPFLVQLLFLGMAQTFDRQFETIAKRLQDCNLSERQMLHQLAGARNPAVPADAAPPDREKSSVYLLARRLASWAGLYLQHAFPAPLFVTDAPAVIDHLTERHPGLVEKAAWPQAGMPKPESGRPAPRDSLLHQVGELVATAAEPVPETPALSMRKTVNPDHPRLILYVDTGRPAATFWAAFCAARQTAAKAADEIGKYTATAIALVVR